MPETVYTVFAVGITLSVAVLALVFQVYEVAPDAVNVTLLPSHTLNAEEAMLIGVLSTVTQCAAVAVQPFAVPVTE
jgi:hypothetical protein